MNRDDTNHDMELDAEEEDVIEIDHDEGEIEQVLAGPRPKQTKKKTSRSSKSKKDAPVPSIAPFQIHKFTVGGDGKRSYCWVAQWQGNHAPGPADLQRKFGPGKYIVKDAAGASSRWQIAPMPGGEQPREQEIPRHVPSPPHMSPDYGGGYRSVYDRQPQHPQPGYQAPPPQTDPYTASTMYRIDSAVAQLQAELRRIGDEFRSLRYDCEQIPGRVSERVQNAIRDAADPFDTSLKVLELSRTMAGDMPESGGGGGWQEAAAAIASRVLPALGGGMPPQMPAPPVQPQGMPPGTIPPQAPPANNVHTLPSGPEPDALPTLDKMTPEKQQEITQHATARGLTYRDAISLGLAQGWDADQLLTFARQTAANG